MRQDIKEILINTVISLSYLAVLLFLFNAGCILVLLVAFGVFLIIMVIYIHKKRDEEPMYKSILFILIISLFVVIIGFIGILVLNGSIRC